MIMKDRACPHGLFFVVRQVRCVSVDEPSAAGLAVNAFLDHEGVLPVENGERFFIIGIECAL
jgi:hypothetical protein